MIEMDGNMPTVVIGFSGDLGVKVLSKLLEAHSIKIVGLMADRKTAQGFDIERLSLPLYVGNPRRDRFERWWRTAVGSACFVVTVNYLFLLDEKALALPANAALNIHGSLLPKYRGRTPHVWAIINGEEYTGITVHYIDEDCDTGDIVVQDRIGISDEMTGNELLEKFSIEYPALILNALSLVQRNDFSGVRQNHDEATVFPKRTPADGGIDWSWNSLRIVNWVRAQANPYPGAFSYCCGKKVVIDKCRVIDENIVGSFQFGEIISVHPVFLVATGSGAVELLEIRDGLSSLRKGLILNHDG